MKILNFATTAPEPPKWEFTPDGFLRCKARVLAERVMPYRKAELQDPTLETDLVRMLVDRETLSEPQALRSLEGVPILIGDHQWLTPDNVKRFAVGSVAGTPRLDGDYLICNLLITDQHAIDKVQSGALPEISAAYSSETLFAPGSFQGKPFDARQTHLRFNHICILPPGHGRAGSDVRILNKILGERSMTPYEKGRAAALARIEALLKGETEVENAGGRATAKMGATVARAQSSLAKIQTSNSRIPVRSALERMGFERIDRQTLAARIALRNGAPKRFSVPQPIDIRQMMQNSKTQRAENAKSAKARRATFLAKMGFVDEK